MQKDNLCPSGKNCPDQVSYVKTEAQLLKDKLRKSLGRILKNEKSLADLSKEEKEYLKPVLFNRNTVSFRTISFLHTLCSIEYLPLLKPKEFEKFEHIRLYFKKEYNLDLNQRLIDFFNNCEYLPENIQFWRIFIDDYILKNNFSWNHLPNLSLIFKKKYDYYLNYLFKRGYENFIKKVLTPGYVNNLIHILDFLNSIEKLEKDDKDWLISSIFEIFSIDIFNKYTSENFNEEDIYLINRCFKDKYHFNASLVFYYINDLNHFFNVRRARLKQIIFVQESVVLFPAFKVDLLGVIGKFNLPPSHFNFNTPEDQEYLNLLLEKLSLNEKFRKNYHSLKPSSIRNLYLALTIYAKHSYRAIKELDKFLAEFNYEKQNYPFCIGVQLLRNLFFRQSYPKLLLSTIEYWEDREIGFFEWIVSRKDVNEFNDIPFRLTRRQVNYLLSTRSYFDGLIINSKIVENTFAASKLISITSNKSVIKSIIHNFPFSHGNVPFEVFEDIARFLSKYFQSLNSKDFWKIINYVVEESLKNPKFQLKYLTVSSLKNRVVRWWEETQLMERLYQFSEFDYILPDENITWSNDTTEDKIIHYDGEKYFFELIKDLQRIVEEGHDLRHCVANYAVDCYRGDIRIYSLQKIDQNDRKKLLTIEVRENEIIQIKGKINREPSELELKIIKLWAIEKDFDIVYN